MSMTTKDGTTQENPNLGGERVHVHLAKRLKSRICGDLYLILHVKEKQGIWRDGLNLVSRINITYTEAILGTVVMVETVEGLKELQIPSGIQPGEILKLSCLGVSKDRESRRGDHVFIVEVKIPKTISDREQKLLEELATFRASSEDYIDGGVNRSKMTTERKDHSHQKGKAGNSVWRSMGRLFQGKQSGKGFASTTMDMPPRICKHGKIDPLFSTSWNVVFLVTCIFALLKNISSKSSQGNGRYNYCSPDSRTSNDLNQS